MEEKNVINPNESGKKLSEIDNYANQYKDAMGFGEVVKILWGTKPENPDNPDNNNLVPDVKDIHICPVPLKNQSKLFENIQHFSNGIADNGAISEEAKKAGVGIILLSLKKMHPEITAEEIEDKFDLAGIAKVVRIAVNVNNFLAEWGKVNEMMENIQVDEKNQQ